MSEAPKPPLPPPQPPQHKITPELRTKIEAWFNAKARGEPQKGTCPICATKNWSILDDFVAPPLFAGGGMILGGIAYPHFMLVCNNCGNAQFINAVAAGVLLPDGSS
jgi:hypothetical protein